MQISSLKGISCLRYALLHPIIRIAESTPDKKFNWGASENISDYFSVTTIEDGFIRSNGLGVHYATPLSLVFDRRGIYYDSRKESDLEYLLNNEKISNYLKNRSEKLISLIINNNITKYNLSSPSSCITTKKEKIILIPGQVEADASIKYGSPTIRSNLSLVVEVRKQNPDAYIIYKPHPDVSSKQRHGGDEAAIEKVADIVIQDFNILSLFPYIDELHTMTSLAGFEALIRNIKVVTYGMPFYAGWGLTTDMMQCERRNKKRSVEELVACALILYPIYYHPDRKKRCEVEEAIEWLTLNKNRADKHQLIKKGLTFIRNIRDFLHAKTG
jgi:capsular polysaccharide export protein